MVIGRIRRRLREAGILDHETPVVVAFSGGPDSTALLLACRRCDRSLANRLIAAHIHHGIQPAADEHERQAREIAAALGVPLITRRAGPQLAGKRNIEDRARAARYRALRDLAREVESPWILTAHTADDQAETVLYRLLRGTGPSGLAGILPLRNDGVVRPALDCRRRDLRMLLRGSGLQCVQDPMNEDPRFVRVRIRRELLPLLETFNPRVTEALCRLAAAARLHGDWARQAAEACLDGVVREGCVLDLQALESQHPALVVEVIRQWLQQAGVPARRLDGRRLAALARMVRERPEGREVDLGGGRRVVRGPGRLLLDPPAPEPPWEPAVLRPGATVMCGNRWRVQAEPVRDGEVPIPAGLHEALIAAGPEPITLQVRPPRPGERLRPLGLGGSRKLSDCFIDRKIARELRWSWPVVDDGQGALWVPGVVRSERRIVRPPRDRFLRLRAWRSRA